VAGLARRRRVGYVTYQPDLAVPGADERVEAFAAVAVESGVRRLVLLSGRNEEGALRGEKAVRESGLEWTVVRASLMNQNFSEGFWRDLVLGRHARRARRERRGAVHRRR
jgi:uncharacterized protein YbjT (DUF2867 family)